MAALHRVLPPLIPELSTTEYLNTMARSSFKYDLREAGTALASRMVRWANVRNAKTWKQASARAQRSGKLHQALVEEMAGSTGLRTRQLVQTNADLITSIPSKLAHQLAGEILEAQQAGARPEAVAKMLRQRLPHLTRVQVKRLGRTQTQQAGTALTHARCTELGIEWYIWLTSQDRRTRKSHKKMNNVLVPWNQPPSPEALVGEKPYGHYHAGSTFNCRCTQEVLLDPDDVTWPHRVYYGGSIKYMTRAQFLRLPA